MTTNTDPVRALAGCFRNKATDERAKASNREYAEWVRDRHHGAAGAYTDCARMADEVASAPPSAPVGVDLPINDAVPPPTETRPGNLFLWNWTAMQQYGRACIAHALAQQPAVTTIARQFDRSVLEPMRQSQQPAAPSGEAALHASIVKEAAEVLQMVADSGVTLPPNWRWPLLDELSGIAYRLAAPQQPAGVDEAPTWSRQQPTVPGIYGIRGFNLCRPASEQFEAVVVVREHGGELVCNLHESTSEDDLESWAPICDLDPDFEWRVFVPGWEQQGGRADG